MLLWMSGCHGVGWEWEEGDSMAEVKWVVLKKLGGKWHKLQQSKKAEIREQIKTSQKQNKKESGLVFPVHSSWLHVIQHRQTLRKQNPDLGASRDIHWLSMNSIIQNRALTILMLARNMSLVKQKEEIYTEANPGISKLKHDTFLVWDLPVGIRIRLGQKLNKKQINKPMKKQAANHAQLCSIKWE